MAHELTKTKIRYLVTLKELDPEGRGIRSVSVARKLNISRPSVHAMIEKLSESGFVDKEFYGIIYLTPKGKRAAEHYANADWLD